MDFQEASTKETTGALVPEVEDSGQDYVVETVFAKVGKHKVRAEVRIGCGYMLSSARVCVWSDTALTWHEMYKLPKMRTPRGKRLSDIDQTLVVQDIEELLAAARAILL